MILIDIETGVEYKSTLSEVKNRIGHFTYDIVATGKTYKPQKDFKLWTIEHGEMDSLLFLKPLEKPEPSLSEMIEIYSTSSLQYSHTDILKAIAAKIEKLEAKL